MTQQPPTTPTLTDADRVRRLEHPARRVDVVLDTDTYNEIDDQFALAYALLSPEHLDVQAVYAAPFHNTRSSGPADGMQRSYEEIGRVLDRLGRTEVPALRGAESWFAESGPDTGGDAAADLIARAMARPADDPLYVVAIGAPTNIAAALTREPRIIDRVVMVWLGGHALHWPNANEFNLQQDVPASRVLFDCGVPLVHLPCQGVVRLLATTRPELRANLAGRSPIADYLLSIYEDYMDDTPARSKVIWDLAPVAWLIDPRWAETILTPSPIIASDQPPRYAFDARRHLIRSAVSVKRDAIFGDLFAKLSDAGA
ncbi:MAG: nucleoside hydrolase [Planctomycetota bacterium]